MELVDLRGDDVHVDAPTRFAVTLLTIMMEDCVNELVEVTEMKVSVKLEDE